MSSSSPHTHCVFCQEIGGELIWQNALCRVVLINDADYVGFCRVILNQHVKEMSDLSGDQQWALMQIVFLVEQVQREILQPDKINLASLGNKTPHVHWHVIPRFASDKNFHQNFEIVRIEQVGYPDYLHFELMDARVVNSWWNVVLIRKSDKKKMSLPLMLSNDFNAKGKIIAETMYYSQKTLEAK